MTPDPARDVMVYQVAMIDALSGASLGDRWTVWLGAEHDGSFDDQGEAISAALALVTEHGRPAWVVAEGGAATPL